MTIELSARAERVLGCLIEKALTTPDQYPLSPNALRAACNQSTGRDPVVAYDDTDVSAGVEELREHKLVRTEHTRGSRVLKEAHRAEDQLELDTAGQALLALLLLRGPQTPGELRARSSRMHPFGSVEEVESTLESLAARRPRALVERRAPDPGRREARWAHLLGRGGASAGATSADGHYRAFHDAVMAGDMETAIDQLAANVIFNSPAVHRPYEGREAAATILRAVSQVFEDFRYLDVLDEGDRAGLVFAAKVGDRELQGWDYLRFDEQGAIVELTVMIRPLSGLLAVTDAMGRKLDQETP